MFTARNVIKRFRESEGSCTRGTRPKTSTGWTRPSGLRRLCIENRHDAVARAQEHFEKPSSVNTVHHISHKHRLKLYHAKRKRVQTRSRNTPPPLVLSSFKKKTVLRSESKSEILFGNDGRHFLLAKEQRDRPACYQHTVQKSASWLTCTPVRLHYCWMMSAVLEQHVLPSRRLFREGLVYFSNTTANHVLHVFQQHGCRVKESGCCTGCLQSRPVIQ